MRSLVFTLALLSFSTGLWAGGGGSDDEEDGDIPLAPVKPHSILKKTAPPSKEEHDELLIEKFQSALRSFIPDPQVFESYIDYLKREEKGASSAFSSRFYHEGQWRFLIKTLELMPEKDRDFNTLTRICSLHQHLGDWWCDLIHRILNKVPTDAIKDMLMDLVLTLNVISADKVNQIYGILKKMSQGDCRVEKVIELTNRLKRLSPEDFEIIQRYTVKMKKDEHGRFYYESFLNMLSTLEILSDKDTLLDPVIKAVNLYYDGFPVADVKAIREHVQVSDMGPYRQRFLITINKCPDHAFKSIMISYIPYLRVLCFTRAWDFAQKRLEFDSQKMKELIRSEYQKIERPLLDVLPLTRLSKPVSLPREEVKDLTE